MRQPGRTSAVGMLEVSAREGASHRKPNMKGVVISPHGHVIACRCHAACYKMLDSLGEDLLYQEALAHELCYLTLLDASGTSQRVLSLGA